MGEIGSRSTVTVVGGPGRPWRSKWNGTQQIEFRWVTLGRKKEANTHIPESEWVVTNRVLTTGLHIRQRGRAPTNMEAGAWRTKPATVGLGYILFAFFFLQTSL